MNEGATRWTGRAIVHLDMDAFFAAVEQLDDPELRGVPVIVGGNPAGRGVVSTASYEARVFGVRSAMPSARAAALCPDAVWVRPRFERYKELSDAVRRILEAETPFVEPASIDEAYADITPGAHGGEDPVAVARRIQERVCALGVTCSIGLSTSKTVSKIASDHDKPRGLTVVRPGTEAAFLAPLPVSALPGIGNVSAEHLAKAGVTTLGALAALDERTARSLLGSHGESAVRRAAGIDDRPVAPRADVKSVSNERTFSADVRAADEVHAAVTALARKVAARLGRKDLAGRTVTLKVRYGDFTTRTVRRTVPVATSDARSITDVALELLGTAWSPGIGVRLLGVGVSGFETPAHQLELLAEETGEPDPRQARLTQSVEAVRERFGEGAIRSGRSVDGGSIDRRSVDGRRMP